MSSGTRSRSSGCARWRTRSPRSPSATSAPTRASTPATGSSSTTSGGAGRSSSTSGAARSRASPDARPRRGHRHRRRHLARAARGPALRARRLPLAAALGARQPRPRRRLRGLLPAARRAPAAAPHPRGAGRQGADLDPDRRRRARDGDPASTGWAATRRSFFETVSALTPELHGPRDRPARASAPRRSRCARPTTPPGSRARCSGSWTRMGIERAHLVGNSLGGRVAIEVGLREPERVAQPQPALPRRWPGAGAGSFVPLVQAAAARARRHPAHASATRSSASSSGACSPGPSASIPSAADVAVEEFLPHLPLARRPGRLPRRGAQHLPRGAQRRATASTPASRSSSRRRCSSGATRTRSSRSPSPATSRDALPERAPGRARASAATSRRSSSRSTPTRWSTSFIGHAQASAASAPPSALGRAARRLQGGSTRNGRPTAPIAERPSTSPSGRSATAAGDERGASATAARRRGERRRAGTEAARARAGGRSPAAVAAAALRRRASRAALTADLDDRDPDYIRENLPLSWLIASLWFRGEVREHGQHPRGRARCCWSATTPAAT